MPKLSTFPYIFDEEKCISISDLKKLKYFNKNNLVSGTINWTNRGVKTGSIGISVLMTNKTNVVSFDYKCNNNEYKYEVQLIAIPSNLGKGKVWYFLCPFTAKRCRKLHLIDERFMHRSALPSGMYSKQTHSKKWRQMEAVFGTYFDRDDIYDELYSKHFKRFYKGKPTKRYFKLLKKIKQAEKITPNDIEKLMILG
ncbi:conserved hypothetical protein [Formosa agariphila KMM 3901]|uniref:Uncharacterized protein n=1 Tax=Formosa agariphila (strain DSM 15362 / KCTC 12365 / LMG 23005 / KMM 3901 / M-2Alg 35-1) TaxID=1347342 RepID=T2KNX2_FORAG|nr:hypothetical protein [Formosa agariphila]CDF80435.1 conserved hypothetical protein [Formosa agariphila KMM 3901]